MSSKTAAAPNSQSVTAASTPPNQERQHHRHSEEARMSSPKYQLLSIGIKKIDLVSTIIS
ncbi:hypothetical protein HNQ59_001026 [Chitinivorax tropicus]|uniref:Uncharacterized protein n=1 Tax=Chitinivorax tropicus TaxID=714531 RepID=A0A840MMM7_9PROT|nr:hypothetical protein [Chitinivorax tropicus]MBB5017756.1 hypothetical protein [Chitinivorax tropicus]